ncbi:MAG: histidine phosphatase family protein [Chitinophagales bacterium]|nr:histidine phosphatase family protein [Chitinophagales bacterium]
MKRIIFVRHAKSSWSNMDLADHDRPLNKRGKRDSPIMAKKLAEDVKHIDLWLISTAKRARKTAKAFQKLIAANETKLEPRIYHAHTSELIQLIHEQDDVHSSCIFFGHNPAFTYLHNEFAAHLLDNLPTCGIFILSSKALKWKDVDKSNTSVETLLYPKMFLNSGTLSF